MFELLVGLITFFFQFLHNSLVTDMNAFFLELVALAGHGCLICSDSFTLENNAISWYVHSSFDLDNVSHNQIYLVDLHDLSVANYVEELFGVRVVIHLQELFLLSPV